MPESASLLSVVALSATFRREASSVACGGFANPPWRPRRFTGAFALHPPLAARLPLRRVDDQFFTDRFFARRRSR
jgi:hypothetical protein